MSGLERQSKRSRSIVFFGGFFLFEIVVIKLQLAVQIRVIWKRTLEGRKMSRERPSNGSRAEIEKTRYDVSSRLM